QYLASRHVVLLPDNDDPGRRHVGLVASELATVAANVKVLALPDLRPKGDVIEWLDAGHSAAELRALAEKAPLWQPPQHEQTPDSARSDQGKVDKAAQLVE